MTSSIIDPGELDELIRFERKVNAAGFKSAGQGTWRQVETVWARVRDVRPNRAERVAEVVTIAARPAAILIRYRDDIDASMRIVMGDLDYADGDPVPEGNRILQIVAGPAIIGRREWLEMMAEDYSTAGGS